VNKTGDCINNMMCLECDNKEMCEHYQFVEENTRESEKGKLE
jgi:hypothetical protein